MRNVFLVICCLSVVLHCNPSFINNTYFLNHSTYSNWSCILTVEINLGNQYMYLIVLYILLIEAGHRHLFLYFLTARRKRWQQVNILKHIDVYHVRQHDMHNPIALKDYINAFLLYCFSLYRIWFWFQGAIE